MLNRIRKCIWAFLHNDKMLNIVGVSSCIFAMGVIAHVSPSNDVVIAEVTYPNYAATAPSDVTEATFPTESIAEPIRRPSPTIEQPTEPTVIETEPPAPVYTKSTEYDGHIYNIGEPSTDLEMLAMIIYQEAGGDATCDDCRRRVGDIVLNRVHSPRFPNTIQEVLLQQGQYGELYWTGLEWKDRASNEGERHAVARAYHIAQEILDGTHSDVYGDYIWQAGFHQGYDEIYHCGHYFGK